MKWTLEASSAAKETYGVPMGRAADGWMWWFKLYLHKLYQMHFTPVTGEADQGPKTKESSNPKSAHFPSCLSLNEVMGRVGRWTSLALSFSDSRPVDTAGTDGTSCSNLCKPHWAPQKYTESTPTTEPSRCVQAAVAADSTNNTETSESSSTKQRWEVRHSSGA